MQAPGLHRDGEDSLPKIVVGVCAMDKKVTGEFASMVASAAPVGLHVHLARTSIRAARTLCRSQPEWWWHTGRGVPKVGLRSGVNSRDLMAQTVSKLFKGWPHYSLFKVHQGNDFAKQNFYWQCSKKCVKQEHWLTTCPGDAS